MAQVISAVNLGSAVIPFMATYKGQSVLVPNRTDSTAGPNRDFNGDTLEAASNVAQLYWGENILPTQEGYGAVSYLQALGAINSTSPVSYTFTVYDGNGSKALIAVLENKEVWGVCGEITSWTQITLPAEFDPADITGNLTNATAYGEVYLFYPGVGPFKLTIQTLTLTAVEFEGLDISVVDGICDSQSYIIAWGKTIVAWSSALDALDFVPSDITGAGAGTPEGVKGQILYCKTISKGFIIYTSATTMAAEYSGNTRFPWIFRAINGGSGIADFKNVSQDSALSSHFAWTSAGLLEVNTLSCTARFPQLTDFFAGRIWEEFNPATKDVDRARLSEQVKVRLAFIASRYFVASYGHPNRDVFDYAVVFDTALKRWGRLRYPHVQVIEITADMEFDPITYLETEPNPYTHYEQSYNSMVNWNNTPAKAKLTLGFVSPDGKVHVVNSSFNHSGANGVAVLGRYKLTRGHLCTLTGIDIQGTFPNEGLTVSDVHTLNGVDRVATLQPVTLLNSGDVTRKYGVRAVGENHSIVLEGNFHLVSLVLSMTQNGRR